MAEGLLDMSLDDIIAKNKKSGGSGSTSRGRGRGGAGAGAGRGFRGRGRRGYDSSAPGPGPDSSAPGPARRFPNRAQSRAVPYFTPQGLNNRQEFLVPGGSDTESGTKLYVSNLDYGVTNEDIKVLFSEVGDLRRCSLHYDKSGRSKGTAEVVFARQSDAVAAVKRYNNVQLDGKPMKIEMVGVKLVAPVNVAMPPANGFLGNAGGASWGQQRGAGSGRERGSGGRGRGGGGRGRGSGGRGPTRGRGRGIGQGEKMSTEDLDADLEKYHKEAMQLN